MPLVLLGYNCFLLSQLMQTSRQRSSKTGNEHNMRKRFWY